MTEIQPHSNESNDEVDKLIPTNMDEAFAVDGSRRLLEGIWNPEDPEWKEEFEAHRLLMDAGMVQPAVNIDKIRNEVAALDQARKAIDEIFDGSE